MTNLHIHILKAHLMSGRPHFLTVCDFQFSFFLSKVQMELFVTVVCIPAIRLFDHAAVYPIIKLICQRLQSNFFSSMILVSYNFIVSGIFENINTETYVSMAVSELRVAFYCSFLYPWLTQHEPACKEIDQIFLILLNILACVKAYLQDGVPCCCLKLFLEEDLPICFRDVRYHLYFAHNWNCCAMSLPINRILMLQVHIKAQLSQFLRIA